MTQRRAKIQLGLVGCGEVVRFKELPALVQLENIQVVAAADLDAGRCRELAERFGIPRQFGSVEALLEAPGVEAVGVCVPPSAHASVAIPAIEAGKHVWIDKPLAVTLDDCDRIASAAGRSRSVLMAGFHMRWHRLVRRVHNLIRSRRLGAVESIRSVWNSPREDLGIPEWRKHRNDGGGALIEIGVHHFDLWRFLSGSEVTEVFAGSRDGTRDDECATVAARLADGVLCTAHLSERAPHQIEIEICGAEGRVRLDCLRFDGLDVYSKNDVAGSPRTRLRGLENSLRALPAALADRRRGSDYMDSYRRAWAHFAASIEGGYQADPNIAEGRAASRIVSAALESRETGRPVRLAVPGADEM